jgi:hypothetical protein
MNINSVLRLSLVALTVVAMACSDDSPSSSTDTPAGCENNVTVSFPNGFKLTGGGLTGVDVNLDNSVSFTDQSLNQVGNDFQYAVGGDYAIGAADTVGMTMVLSFVGGQTGTRNWDNLAGGSGSYGVVMSVTEGNLAGEYRAVSGRTTLTNFFEDFDNDTLSFAGTFCGTLKDSLNRVITVEGGSFSYTN